MPTNGTHNTINIPADLRSVSKLLTSRHWERAAIVWAYCEPQQGKRTSGENTQGRLSFDEFASHGIAGLRTRKTVAFHWHAWQSAIEAGKATEVTVGQSGVTAPDMPWPTSATTEEGQPAQHHQPITLANWIAQYVSELDGQMSELVLVDDRLTLEQVEAIRDRVGMSADVLQIMADELEMMARHRKAATAAGTPLAD